MKKEKGLEEIIKSLENVKIRNNIDGYKKLVDKSDTAIKRSRILSLIFNNSENLIEALPLVHTLCSKMEVNGDEQLAKDIVNQIRKNKENTEEEESWILKIIFILIEKVKKSTEIKSKALEVLKSMYQRINITNHLIELTSASENSADTIFEILNYMPCVIDEFIRMSLKDVTSSNLAFLRNFSSVIAMLAKDYTSKFINLNYFGALLDSEHHFLRTCFLEILYFLILYYKKVDEVSKINDLLAIIDERIHDTNFYVRSKTISIFHLLFENNCVPLEKRNMIIGKIGDRIKDKTVIVRKKAVHFCSFVLVNHPFVQNGGIIGDNLIKTENDAQNEFPESYYKNLEEFHDHMTKILTNINFLIHSNMKSETIDCIEFVKLAYFFKINGAKKLLDSLFELTWSLDDTNFIDTLVRSMNDLYIQSRMKDKTISMVSFLSSFIKPEGCLSFERILKEMAIRNFINKNVIEELYTCFFNGIFLFESTYILSHTLYVKRALIKDLNVTLNHATEILFSSQNDKQLKENLKVYKNALNIILTSKKKIPCEDELFKLLSKNIAKMNFFDYEAVEQTISIFYNLSDNPEKNGIYYLNILSRKNSNLLKTIFSVGCIGLKHSLYLDDLERALKVGGYQLNIEKSILIPDNIREKRKSINASRMSLDCTLVNDSVMLIEGQENNVVFRDKSDEEIADLIFYIKEKEMLYGENSLLSSYVPLVLESCRGEDEELLNVAYLTLFRLMCVSSEFFIEYFDLFLNAVNHSNFKVRNNCVIAMSDFVMLYNTVIEKHTNIIYNKLSDDKFEIRKNTLLIIFYLLKNNLLKIKGNSIALTLLLTDDNSEIRNITRNLMKEISYKENMISTIFYESILGYKITTYDSMKTIVDFLVKIIEKEKTKEQLFLKIVNKFRNSEDDDFFGVIKYLYQSLCLNEKSVSDMNSNEDFRYFIDKLGVAK